MTLLDPLWLPITGLLLLAAWVSRHHFIGRDNWHKVISPQVLGYLRTGAAKGYGLSPLFITAAIITLALSTPATHGTKSQQAYIHPEVWLVVVDVSESMSQDDITPTRLNAAKSVMTDIERSSEARPMGMILYAGDAFLAHPPTLDRESFGDFTQALSTDLIELKGSRPDRALSLAENIIHDGDIHRARIWLVTDSGGLDQQSANIAEKLNDSGHRLDVILTALPQHTTPEPVNQQAAETLAKVGGGQFYKVDALGELDNQSFNALSLQAEEQNLKLSLGGYTLWSQWLLLFLLPFVLLLMRRNLP